MHHEEIPQHFIIDNQLWARLREAEPNDICHNCEVYFDAEGYCYHIPVLAEVYGVFPEEETIVELTRGVPLAEHYQVEFTLFLLHYLLDATDRPLAGQRVSEKELPGGEMFFRGPHTLHTQGIQQKFGTNPQGLIVAGLKLHGRKVEQGDASVELLPAPKIPVTYVLWAADEEFPASVSILFDPTIQHFLPLDIIYGMCIFTAHRLLEAS